jgi:hypothetical protein
MKNILFLLFLSGLFSLSYSQTINSDTLNLKNFEQFENDTIPILFGDSTIIEHEIVENDSVHSDSTRMQQLSEACFSMPVDSINVDSSLLKYKQYINQLSDSVLFYEPDTSDFIIRNIQSLLKCDSLVMNDSLRQAVDILFKSYKSRNIEASISYLEQAFLDSSLVHIIDSSNNLIERDSTLNAISETIVSSLKYIISSMPEDSLNLTFTNMERDSIFLNVKESESDSIRLKLFDNRGEFAILWIAKSEDNRINMYFEDGTTIEKPKLKKKINKKIDTNLEEPSLRKMRRINIIVPLWEFETVADIRFNQGYLDSWAEGGENSMSALSTIKSNLNYSYGKLRSWETTLEYKLGYLKAGDNPIQKNDDKLEFNTKFGKTAFKDWYYSALLNFKTQILKGYDYPNDTVPVSEFMSPANLVFSLGLDYKPNKKLTVLISPITSKFTIVADTSRFDQTRFGVGEDEIIRKEIGAYIKAISKIKFTEKIILENKINFFTNYAMKPQNIDVDWEVDLAVKLNNNIKLSVNAHIIYDDDVNYVDKEGEVHGPRLQFKEMLGVGFVYSF